MILLHSYEEDIEQISLESTNNQNRAIIFGIQLMSRLAL